MVCANIQSGHPGLNTTIVPYTYFDKHDLAVVAVTTADTAFISSPGPTTTFSDPITTIQKTVDDIQAKYSKNTKIVAVTHIGYELDQQLAQQTRGIYLVIGGHSHTLLGDMAGAEGPYPTIEKVRPGFITQFLVTDGVICRISTTRKYLS
jgi:2',3'-cyclic-nucleotide 2'-phosphodiesterase (5'-nucleotidase family)